jgi:ubiquinone/menaquinone biosynthesis C-methylase UbiE
MTNNMQSTNQKSRIVTEIREIGGGFIDPERVIADWDIKKGDKIADLGCGGGYFTIPIAQLIGDEGKMFAADVMEGPIESVKSRAYLAKLTNVMVIRVNLEKKNSLSRWIGNGGCDKVLLASVLYTTDKKRAIIIEAKRILKKGGSLIVVEWKKNAKSPRGSLGHFGPPGKNRIGEEELKNTIKKEGFKFVKGFESGSFHYGLIFSKQ